MGVVCSKVKLIFLKEILTIHSLKAVDSPETTNVAHTAIPGKQKPFVAPLLTLPEVMNHYTRSKIHPKPRTAAIRRHANEEHKKEMLELLDQSDQAVKQTIVDVWFEKTSFYHAD